MRFFTVPNAKQARKSVLVATLCVAFFFCVVSLMGLAAIVIVGQNPVYFEGGNIAGKMIGGINMPALHLAHAVGGNLLLGFLAAVAFATILAVVSGLALAGARRSRTTFTPTQSSSARRRRRQKCASPRSRR